MSGHRSQASSIDGGTGAVRGRPPAETGAGDPEPGSGAGTAYQHWPLASRLPLGALPSAVPCARLHTSHILREWNLDDVADDAEMVVSELTTNAVKVSWSLEETQPVVLHLLASHEYLIIQVWDAVSAPPDPRPHAVDAEAGRGLEIVSVLSHRWGFYHPDGGGKLVWAAIKIGQTRTLGPPRED